MNVRIDDLAAEELQTLLTADGDQLTWEEAEAVEEFLSRVGGLENAQLAVQLLSRIERCA